MNLRVEKASVLATVQDLGRPGWQRHGVSVGGAADRHAARVANQLVGNPPEAALLEFTLTGPRLRFEAEALVALVGSAEGFEVNRIAMPVDRPVRVPAGAQASFERPFRGCRAWLAIAGGVAVPLWLGSRSTDLRAGQGGWAGRALTRGDVLPLGPCSPSGRALLTRLRASPQPYAPWAVAIASRRAPVSGACLRAVPGPEWDQFAPEVRAAFFAEAYRVTPAADRMGLRLQGPPLPLSAPREMWSSAVVDGTVQVPPDGQPIVLLADRQTVGGYPRLAVIARVDLPIAAQLRPGDAAQFVEITLEEAWRLAEQQDRDLQRATAALRLLAP